MGTSGRLHAASEAASGFVRRLLFSPWIRWPVGLLGPLLLLGAVAGMLGGWEYRTRDCSRWLGHQLLAGNAGRAASGAAWEAVLATRQARTRIQDVAPSDTLPSGTIPQGPLRYQYTQQVHSPDFVVLGKKRRRAPLRAERLSEMQMRDLAKSLRIYQRGKVLLQHLTLPVDEIQLQAAVRARLALQEGTLYDELHRDLLTHNEPEAWDFVRMSKTDSAYWRHLLRPALAPGTPGATELSQQTPAVAAAVSRLLSGWRHALHQEEIERLRSFWEHGPDFQIRLVRNMNIFAGYAVPAGAPPMPFELPAGAVAAALDLPAGGPEP